MSDFVLSCCAPCDLNAEWMQRRGIEYVNFNLTLDGAPLKDDMGVTTKPRELLQKMIDSDVIVFASPVYFYSIDAQMKAI